MCQIQIYNFLRDLRATRDEKYYIATEVYDMMKKLHKEITYRKFSYKLTMLLHFGFLEKASSLRLTKGRMYNRVQYRAKAR